LDELEGFEQRKEEELNLLLLQRHCVCLQFVHVVVESPVVTVLRDEVGLATFFVVVY
jgi:hypothetical protein